MKERLLFWAPFVAAGLIASFCGWRIAVRPHQLFRDLVKKYPPGTQGTLVLNGLGPGHKMIKTGNILPYEPTEQEKRNGVFYFITVPSARGEIELNFYGEVVSVTRSRDLRKPQ